MFDRALLGTGLIGAALARAAVGRGERVIAWNRSPEKCAPLAEHGVHIAASAAEAARQARIVHLALTADAAVDAVLDAIGEDVASAGTIVVDHSTTEPALTAARGVRCAQKSITFLHGPVFMSPTACLKSAGSMVVAGPRHAFDAVRPRLEAMTGTVRYVGEQPDAAATLKLVGNCYIVSAIGALADGFAIGRARGLDPAVCHKVFEILDPRMAIAGRGGRMARGDLDETFWSLAMARKDIGLMQATAGSAAGAVLPGLATRIDGLIDAGLGERDLGILGAASVAQVGESTD